MLTGKQIAITGALLSGVAVAAGAFGAHALKSELTPDRLETYKTAISYLQWHALGLLILGIAFHQRYERTFQRAAILMALGIVFFCGSLITLVLTGYTILGAVAPIGGLLFMASWAVTALGLYKSL